MKQLRIVVVHGDGIGPDVCGAALEVLAATPGVASRLAFEEHPGGANHYRASGAVLPEATFTACRDADAILHGAAGLPDVLYPDGTEAGTDFGLQLRFRLDLYANIRPIRLLPGVESPLRRKGTGDIDYVIVRENTEGLYAARNSGVVLREEVASDALVLTRKGIERVCVAAFELARKRKGAPKDGKRRVTCCDKANVLRSYAFFRRVFDQVADRYPDVERDYSLADAMTIHLIERPEHYDVIVMENMFGDIMSDLAATTAGGMGMSPSAELSESRGLFQAAHGSAPSLAGRDLANPYGTILSSAMMLRWLGERHGDDTLARGAASIERAVDAALATPAGRTRDLGGHASTRAATRLVREALAARG